MEEDISSEINAVQHCYFAVKGFDMCGGDIYDEAGFTSEDEAIAAIKKRISFNDNYCGNIYKEEDNRYHIFVKNKTEANPSMNLNTWHRCTNIFYGKRILIDKEYFALSGLDMYGGDLENGTAKSFEEAYLQALKLIDNDPSRCAMIQDNYQKNEWKLFLKDPKKCNPSYNTYSSYAKGKNHWKSTVVFLGKEV